MKKSEFAKIWEMLQSDDEEAQQLGQSLIKSDKKFCSDNNFSCTTVVPELFWYGILPQYIPSNGSGFNLPDKYNVYFDTRRVYLFSDLKFDDDD